MKPVMQGLIAATVLSAPAAAHDFWIQPASFAPAAGVPVTVSIQVGHGQFRQRWGVKAERVTRFNSIGPSQVVDWRSALHPDSGAEDATVTFTGSGTHVLVLETTAASSTLPAIRFNDYLAVEGLTPALEQRARLGLAKTDGRESYSRRAKALVQIGPATRDQPQVLRPVGLTLEIVPQINPYALTPGELLPVRIIYNGKPLAGATVKLNNLDFDTKPLATRLTDARGIAAFDVPRRGRWQLNVIWTRPLSGNPLADFDTTFSSLTFGFQNAVSSR